MYKITNFLIRILAIASFSFWLANAHAQTQQVIILDSPHPRSAIVPTELPSGTTILTIVSQIIAHGDLRDKDFILSAIGFPGGSQTLLSNYYKVPGIKPDAIFQFVYSTYELGGAYRYIPHHNPHQIVGIMLMHIPQSLCVKYDSFASQFKSEPKVYHSHALDFSLGNMDHEYTKDINADYSLILLVSAKGSCATQIEINMLKKSDNSSQK